jgi:hypothetical protein
MTKMTPAILVICALLCPCFAAAQVKTTRDRMMFYTSGCTGERSADGPKVPDQLPGRAIDASGRWTGVCACA